MILLGFPCILNSDQRKMDDCPLYLNIKEKYNCRKGIAQCTLTWSKTVCLPGVNPGMEVALSEKKEIKLMLTKKVTKAKSQDKAEASL